MSAVEFYQVGLMQEGRAGAGQMVRGSQTRVEEREPERGGKIDDIPP